MSGDGIGGVCPEEEESAPAEELNESDGPEHGGGCLECTAHLCEHVAFFLVGLFGHAVVFGIQFRGHLFDFCECVKHAKQENERAEVEGECHCGGHFTFGGLVADEECENDGCEVSDE